jgi:RNA polymerase sigma factor (sigma-70 family)
VATLLDTRLSARLLARARGGDERARDRVIRELMPMAQRVARRFSGPQHPVEDLAQVAGIAVLKALERFDTNRDAQFATYAHALMTGEVRRHVRDSRMVRIPRSIYEQVPAFQRTLSRLRLELAREPSRQEVADALGVTKEDVVEIIDAALTAQHISLDAAAEENGGELELGHHDDDFARAEAGADLAPMLSVLTERERMIIDMRFEEGLSQSEIAQALSLSQTQVSRLIRAALAKLSKRAGIAA